MSINTNYPLMKLEVQDKQIYRHPLWVFSNGEVKPCPTSFRTALMMFRYPSIIQVQVTAQEIDKNKFLISPKDSSHLKRVPEAHIELIAHGYKRGKVVDEDCSILEQYQRPVFTEPCDLYGWELGILSRVLPKFEKRSLLEILCLNAFGGAYFDSLVSPSSPLQCLEESFRENPFIYAMTSSRPNYNN